MYGKAMKAAEANVSAKNSTVRQIRSVIVFLPKCLRDQFAV